MTGHNRIAIVLGPRGELETIVSDVPVRVFVVDDSCARDRVYEMTGPSVEIGPERMRAALRDDPIGHAHDELGTGHGPRKPSSTPSLRLVEGDH